MTDIPRKLANLSRTARLFERALGNLGRDLGTLAGGRPVEVCRIVDEASSALVRRELRRLHRRIAR